MKAVNWNFYAAYCGRYIDPHSIKPMASQVREHVIKGDPNGRTWKQAYRDGWRVKRVHVFIK